MNGISNLHIALPRRLDVAKRKKKKNQRIKYNPQNLDRVIDRVSILSYIVFNTVSVLLEQTYPTNELHKGLNVVLPLSEYI